MYCYYYLSTQGLVLVCTERNDPETLKKILLNRDNEVSFDNGGQSENPMIAASLDNNLQCMQLLYKAGYRIHLAEEDANAVNSSMEVPGSDVSGRVPGEFCWLENCLVVVLMFESGFVGWKIAWLLF